MWFPNETVFHHPVEFVGEKKICDHYWFDILCAFSLLVSIHWNNIFQHRIGRCTSTQKGSWKRAKTIFILFSALSSNAGCIQVNEESTTKYFDLFTLSSCEFPSFCHRSISCHPTSLEIVNSTSLASISASRSTQLPGCGQVQIYFIQFPLDDFWCNLFLRNKI